MELNVTGTTLRRAFALVIHDAAQERGIPSDWKPSGACSQWRHARSTRGRLLRAGVVGAAAIVRAEAREYVLGCDPLCPGAVANGEADVELQWRPTSAPKKCFQRTSLARLKKRAV